MTFFLKYIGFARDGKIITFYVEDVYPNFVRASIWSVLAFVS